MKEEKDEATQERGKVNLHIPVYVQRVITVEIAGGWPCPT